ncbi:Protein flp [Colletotrichum siamense]|nr:Protein flp [Colletotrichum siamense]
MRAFLALLALSVTVQAIGEDAAQRPLQSSDDDPSVLSSDIGAYIEGLMEEWHVPGLSVAAVDGDKTWAKGYGYAVLNSTPATPHTLFYTGSTTKSFTAAGLSLLVDNSTSLTWTTPVSSVLDDFVLSDAWATAHVTLEDALSHRTGYPRHDLASSATTAREMVRNLRNLPMSAEPRARYQYCNKMFGVMGYLIETLTGRWLGDFLRERLWEPMGMEETYFSLRDAEGSGLVLANEYVYDPVQGRHLQVPHEPFSAEEGAGSIISNVLDYAKYLRVMMNEDAPLSKDGHREVKTPRSFSSMSKPPFVGPVTYAFGWNQAVFEGERAYFHSGQVNQFVSIMIMIPSKKFAVTVMSNTESPAIELIADHLLYEHFGVPKEKRLDLNKQYKSQKRLQQKYLENCGDYIYPSVPEPPLLPTLPISDHIGEYSDPGYGTVKVDLHCEDADLSFLGYNGKANEQCKLRVLNVAGVGWAFMKPVLYLEPKSGNYWVGRLYIKAGDAQNVTTPSICMRAEFKVDVTGTVTELGLDLRLENVLEGIPAGDGPLVWFKRVDE